MSLKDRKARNPYYSRYGERWVEKLKTSSSMSKFCCITDLIRFMMKEAENLMKGYVHEDQRPQKSKKSLLLKIWREMGREVKDIIIHVKILLYH